MHSQYVVMSHRTFRGEHAVSEEVMSRTASLPRDITSMEKALTFTSITSTVMYDQSLRSLPLQKQGETAPKISQSIPLHFTDGFRSHGDLTPSVDDGSLQRKCFS